MTTKNVLHKMAQLIDLGQNGNIKTDYLRLKLDNSLTDEMKKKYINKKL